MSEIDKLQQNSHKELLPDDRFINSWIETPILETFDIIANSMTANNIVGNRYDNYDFHLCHGHFQIDDIKYFSVTLTLNESDEIAVEGDKIVRCYTHLDFSREGFLNLRKKRKKDHPDETRLQNEGILNKNQRPSLLCRLINTREFLEWLADEEVAHAEKYFDAGSVDEIFRQKKEYEDFLKKNGREVNHAYDGDIIELEAGRKVVLSLAQKYERIDPLRADYFYKIYGISMKKNVTPMPDISIIMRQFLTQNKIHPNVLQ